MIGPHDSERRGDTTQGTVEPAPHEDGEERHEQADVAQVKVEQNGCAERRHPEHREPQSREMGIRRRSPRARQSQAEPDRIALAAQPGQWHEERARTASTGTARTGRAGKARRVSRAGTACRSPKAQSRVVVGVEVVRPAGRPTEPHDRPARKVRASQPRPRPADNGLASDDRSLRAVARSAGARIAADDKWR